MSGIEIDNSNNRIWLLRYPDTFQLGDFRQLFVDVRRLNPDSYRHAVLIDFSRMDALSATAPIRKEAAKVLQENQEFLAETTVAESRIAPSALVRGMLTVFDWLHPKPWLINDFVSGHTAEDWLRVQLEQDGIEVPVQRVWTTASLARSA